MTVQEQSPLIPSYHITVTKDIQYLMLTVLEFVRVMENGQELLPSVEKVCVPTKDKICDINAFIIG